MIERQRPWYSELTRYHWFVLLIAALGWLFDCLDQQLFNLARKPAMQELLVETPGVAASSALVDEYAGHATAIFLIGWAIGGLFFGVLGDRIGRAKTMMITILVYSVCTGLSAFSTGFWDFAFYRFITGLGVGGEFAVGVALVAEVMPDKARPFALGLLQALSAVGNVSAAFISMGLGQVEQSGMLTDLKVFGFQLTAWRIMFLVGTVPALLAVVIRRNLKEPERWQHAVHEGALVKKVGSYRELFGHPVWRKHAFVGLTLAFAGVVGLWGIGFFSFDLLRTVFRAKFERDGMSPAEIGGNLSFWIGITSVMQNIGGFLGIWAFSRLTHNIGRKTAFAIGFVAAAVSTGLVFWFVDDSTIEIGGYTIFSDVLWMIPIMGFCQLSLFGGYAIYFPELFPTHLRSTGTSFCYNVGRLVAAVGPSILGLLSSKVFIGLEREPMRYAGVAMCGVFLIGLLALPFAPETKDKPLPE